MPIDILMPALSPTMEEGTLSKWLKNEGDKVASGDVLAEIETDKATMEVEAIDEGVLGKIVVPAGTENVKVNAVIAVILEEGESASDIGSAKQADAAPAAAAAAEAPAEAEAAKRPAVRVSGSGRGSLSVETARPSRRAMTIGRRRTPSAICPNRCRMLMPRRSLVSSKRTRHSGMIRIFSTSILSARICPAISGNAKSMSG